MQPEQEIDGFYLEYKPKYKIFHELMTKRMRNVLLVSSIYDSFMLEEDGRLSDQIYEEFQNLNLRTLPRITRVSSARAALETLSKKDFDLVITMRRLGDIDAFAFGEKVKEIKDIPVILLLNSVVELKYLPEQKTPGIDRVFVWNGDSKIFIAIIKHLEDRINADPDTKRGNVRVFIFVDDSTRFYSLLLPELYGEIMRQTHRLITEGTDDFQDLLKMRARPKILLAETFEEAMYLFERYKDNVMGIISDVEFPMNDELNKEAGFLFVEKVRDELLNVPVVLQSVKKEFKERAEQLSCFFIHKRSHGLLWDLRKWLLECVGFGDFTFRTEDGKKLGRAGNITEFQKMIETVPIESIYFHGKNDHFSNWLRARGEFEIARKIKPRKVSEFTDKTLREFLRKSINEIITEKTRRTINDFSRDNYRPDILFLRLRPGSLGGKGRGLAFIMFLLSSFELRTEFPDVDIDIPKTVVIGTDEFDKFMEDNDLYDFAVSNVSDEKIRKRFVKAHLSKSIRADLAFLLKDLQGPLAVRSSSVLEDSAYQPFAGIFSTYMLPNNDSNAKNRLEQLCQAIKLVYASPFLKAAKSYAESIAQTVEESKMAVVIQKVVGREYNDRFYPDFSGTASSFNYYPIGSYMKPEDKIAHVALGLGKTIVDGGNSMRFSPKYPKVNLYSTPDTLLNSSQREYYAIDLKKKQFDLSLEEPFLVKLGLDDAIEDGTLTKVADTYDFTTNALRIGYRGEGSPVLSFGRQLKLSTSPLPRLLLSLLSLGERTMGCSVEIEFACCLKKQSNDKDSFYLLQIRPFLQQEMIGLDDIDSYNVKDLFAYSTQVSGNLIRKDLCDIVFVKPDTFDKMKTLEMLAELDMINKDFSDEGRKFILLGFGRWGTSDRFLGIPAKWNNISEAGVIIEAELEDFRIDFSQGSHFFHNIVTSNIAYLHLKYKSEEHRLDWNWLLEQKAHFETKHFRVVRTKKPFVVKVDAQKREAIIIKPTK